MSLLLEEFAKLKIKVHTLWSIGENVTKSYRVEESLFGAGKGGTRFFQTLSNYGEVLFSFLPVKCDINWHGLLPLKIFLISN